MRRSMSFRIILTAMFAAMVCVSTLCIQIASPMGGYINLGDALVLISAWLLGPIYGTAAAGLGSALADLLSGYAYYAPGTLLVKAGVAFIASLIYEASGKRLAPVPRMIAASLPAETLMIVSYLLYAWLFLGHGASAIASVPANCAQAVAGIAIACFLTPIMQKPSEIQEMLLSFKKK